MSKGNDLIDEIVRIAREAESASAAEIAIAPIIASLSEALAEAEKKGAEDEREACARLCEEWNEPVPGYCERADDPVDAGAGFASEKLAALIRVRDLSQGGQP